MKRLYWIIPLVFFIAFMSCKKELEETEPSEPTHVTVQHILIAFKGSIPEESVTRTQSEAKDLAYDIFYRAKKGEDFDTLVKEFTDDQYPGIYSMSNFDVTPDGNKGEYSRSKMVKAFGDVGFALAIDEIGLAEYEPVESKYGWHIIKRIK